MNFSTLCIILVTFGLQTPEFTLLIIAPFSAIQPKLSYHVKYLTISWTYLDLLYRFGRRISGDDYPNIHCYGIGNQLKLGDVCKRRVERPILFALAFNNGLADRKSAFKRFSGNNQATSWPNLVNFRPIISACTLLKRAIFAAICHVSVSKRIGRSQFWFQHNNRQSFLYTFKKFSEIRFSDSAVYDIRSCTVGVAWNNLYSLLRHSTTDWPT